MDYLEVASREVSELVARRKTEPKSFAPKSENIERAIFLRDAFQALARRAGDLV